MPLNIIIDDFGKSLITDLRKSLVSKGVTFGGGGESKLSAKMRYTITQDNKGLSFNLVMPDYGYWLDKGRKPGPVSQAGQASISDWVKRKGIVGKFQQQNLQDRIAAHKTHRKPLKKLEFNKAVKALTFLVSRKVAKHGYKPTHFISDVLNDGRLKKFQADISAELKRQITIELK